MAAIDYSKILEKSFKITKSNKWLWVYGLALTIFSSSGGGGGWDSLSKNFNKIPKQPFKETVNLSQTASNVLGAATSNIANLLSRDPWSIFFLGVGFVISVLFSLVVAWVARSWAKGALIAAIEESDSGKSVTLASGSGAGIAKLKKVLTLSIVSSLITFAIFGGLTFLYVILGLLSNSAGSVKIILYILWTTIYVFSLIILVIYLSMISVYAERLVILRGFSAWDAWRTGLSLSRKGFLNTLIMGIINIGVGCLSTIIFGVVVLGTFGSVLYILIAPVLTGEVPMDLARVIIIAVFILSFVYVNFMFRAIVTVFSYGNWNLFFKEIINKSKIKI